MEILKTLPTNDGFYMPGEFEKHYGTFLIWPVRPGSWTNAGCEAKPVFTRLAKEIAETEELFMLVDHEHYEEAAKALGLDKTPSIDAKATQMVWDYHENIEDTDAVRNIADHIHLIEIETDDAWARDIGPTFVVDSRGQVRGINWKFNAWGGDFDGLYEDYEKDDAAAMQMSKAVSADCYDAGDFVLEGGSIHCDGEGTCVVTEACLLSQGRNPSLTKEQIEDKLKAYLGVTKVIWLPNGIYNDETNEHVDNVFAFVKPGEAVLAWTDDESDPQYAMSLEDLKVLERERDAKGRKIKVHKILTPKEHVRITREELEGFEFAEGEDMREEGERLAASYANYYICNGKILLPQFGDENDAKAVAVLQECYPDRKVVPIYARPVIVGGGNFHCITQQIPARFR